MILLKRIDALMATQHVTLGDISRASHVSRSTLSHAWHKPVEKWSVRVLMAFAIGLGESPNDLLVELLPAKQESAMKEKVRND